MGSSRSLKTTHMHQMRILQNVWESRNCTLEGMINLPSKGYKVNVVGTIASVLVHVVSSLVWLLAMGQAFLKGIEYVGSAW